MQGRMRIYHAVDQSDRTDGTGGHGDLRAGCFGLPDSHSSRLTRTPPPPAPEGDADAASAPAWTVDVDAASARAWTIDAASGPT